MSTAVADPVETKAAPGAAAAATPPAPAAGSPAGAGAGSGVGGAPASASGEPAKGAAPTGTAPPAKALLADAVATPPDAAKTPTDAAAEAKALADAWKLEAPKDVTVDAADLTAVETFAKENGLSKAQAEKVLARDITARAASTAAQTAEREAAITTAANTFAEQVEKHPDLGGAKLPQTIANAKRALVAFATPDERKAILASPFGNHPVLIAILNRAAASLPVEDSAALAGSANAPAEVASHIDAAHAVYGPNRPR